MAKLLSFLKGLVLEFPALASGATGIIITLAARFGLHVTATELASVVSGLWALLAAWTHTQSVPTQIAKPVKPLPKL